MYELRFSRKTDVFSALLSLRESGTKNFLCVTRKLIRTWGIIQRELKVFLKPYQFDLSYF